MQNCPIRVPIVHTCAHSTTSIHTSITAFLNSMEDYRHFNKKSKHTLHLQNQPPLHQQDQQTLTCDHHIQNLIENLCIIKSCIFNNKHNYNNTPYGRMTFPEIYQFIIQCLSNDSPPQISTFLNNVLSLMTKFWVSKPNEFKTLYNGILELIQQREYCIKNCVAFLCEFVEVVQEHEFDQCEFLENKKDEAIFRKKQQKFMENSYGNFERFFINHFLNEFLGLGGIFLDRAVIRNVQREQKADSENQLIQKNSFTGPCHPLQTNSTSLPIRHSLDEQSHEDDQLQLYKICAQQQQIHLLLKLIYKCITYDFQHINRTSQQNYKHYLSTQIILPTKFSKYSKFQQFDIFLKQENVTEMLNYLFLVLKDPQVKLIIIKLLTAMSKIHFRYFKNKLSHRIYLENLVLVIGNLIIGLDFQDNGEICSESKYSNLGYKIELAIHFGEALNCLLVYQPTVYSLDSVVIENLLQSIHTFIVNQLLSIKLTQKPHHKKHTQHSKIFIIEQNPQDEDFHTVNSAQQQEHNQDKQYIQINQLVVLVDLYINLLPKVEKMCEIYLGDNEKVGDLLNDVMFIVGKNYKDFLGRWLIDEKFYLLDQIGGVECLKVLLQYFGTYDPKFNPSQHSQSQSPEVLSKQIITLLFQWLCSFSHKLQSTTSHHNNLSKKVIHQWEIQNNFDQLCDLISFFHKEIIDFSKSAPLSQKLNPDLQPTLRRMYILTLTYINDKIAQECKIVPSQYLQLIQLNIVKILHWIIEHRLLQRNLVESSLKLVQYSKNVSSMSGEFDQFAGIICDKAEILFRDVYREEEMQLLAKIIVEVLEAEHFLEYKEKLSGIFGLTDRYSKLGWKLNKSSQYRILKLIIQNILEQDKVFNKKASYHKIYYTLREQYLGIKQTHQENVIEQIYQEFEKTQSINTDLLQILSSVLELESDCFYHLDSLQLFCQLAPVFILFIQKHALIQTSKLESLYQCCLLAVYRLLQICTHHRKMLLYLNTVKKNQTPFSTSEEIYHRLLSSTIGLLLFIKPEKAQFRFLPKQNYQQLLKHYLKLCEITLQYFPKQIMLVQIGHGSGKLVLEKVFECVLGLMRNYDQYFGEEWICCNYLGTQIVDALCRLFLLNDSLQSIELNEQASLSNLIKIFLNTLSKKFCHQHQTDFFDFHKLIEFLNFNHQNLCKIMDRYSWIVLEAWPEFHRCLVFVDQYGIQATLQKLYNMATSENSKSIYENQSYHAEEQELKKDMENYSDVLDVEQIPVSSVYQELSSDIIELPNTNEQQYNKAAESQDFDYYQSKDEGKDRSHSDRQQFKEVPPLTEQSLAYEKTMKKQETEDENQNSPKNPPLKVQPPNFQQPLDKQE